MSDPQGKPELAYPARGQAPPELDTGRAHSARIYDYWLGGRDNFAADREAAEQAIAANPGIVADVRANRAFLARAVRHLAVDCQIRQFLDIGTGLPTASNTHQVAQSVAPDARVVYADNDPIVLAHARTLLASTPEGATAYLDADLRDTAAILEAAAQTLDLARPVALMLLIVLHLVPGPDDAYGIVAGLVRALAPGSYLVLAHPASDIRAAAMAEMTRRVNQQLAGPPATMRDRAAVTRFFDGLELLEPGVVQPQQWRPDAGIPGPAQVTAWCAVARKPRSAARRCHPARRPASAAGGVGPHGGPMARDLAGRIRAVCLALPEVTERPSHGAPTWFVSGRKAFVTLWEHGHHGNEFPHLWCAGLPGVQQELAASEPGRYFRPPYVGGRGWIGVRLDGDLDWTEVAELCQDAYRAIAPARLTARLGS